MKKHTALFIIISLTSSILAMDVSAGDKGWIKLSGKEATDVYIALQQALSSTKFEDCDIEIDPKSDEYAGSVFSCGNERYDSKRFNVKSKDETKLLFFRAIEIGNFDCDPNKKVNSVYRDASGKRVKWVRNSTLISPKYGQLVETVFDLDTSGLGISSASFIAADLVKVNTGSIAFPNWVSEKKTVLNFQCKTILY